ncbi:MAG: formylmethanofuran dehydrogenase subunit C [Ignavibacteria bacterium]|jgi:formylmethanofuran dehydrogenase subunit C|nr:formylmethanofuran dehydrogenase subunit C [Ignavibacteria bacterium]
MTIILTPLKEFKLPIIAECITPAEFEGKKLEEIAVLPIYEGNMEKTLSDIYKIEQDESATPTIVINGDNSKVRRIGKKMKAGEIIINGNAGMHLGMEMKGGKITVKGDALGWTGAEMKGGTIEIFGNGGDYLASPFRAAEAGMKGGLIIVHGDVGHDVAAGIKGGIVKVMGNAGNFLGFHMAEGTIFVAKNIGSRAGAYMTGGKIIVGGTVGSILPTFSIDSIKPKVKVDDTQQAAGPFYVFMGDLTEKTRGKIFANKASNPQLSIYEKYL